MNTDIYLLRDGKEIGPFTEETTQSFLNQGAILMDDLAWTPGMPAWSPLMQVLHPAALQTPTTAPVETPPAGEPATAKQKAFLSYMGIAFSSDTTKERAAVLVNEAMEDPALNPRVLHWNDDRLTLHPDLFAAEAKAKKDDRANHFFEASQREGADRLHGVTKAHCQVLIGYLDVSFPNWDADESDAMWSYFFPAVAEKFPQLVQKAWRGKLKFPDGPKVAAELVAESRVNAPRTRPSPAAALVRGIVFGLALLLALYVLVQMYLESPDEPATSALEPDPTPAKQSVPPNVAGISMREAIPVDRTAAVRETAPPDAGMSSTDRPAEPLPDTSSAGDGATAAITPKTVLVITKPTLVQVRAGSAKLPVGKQLKIVSRDGATVKVIFQDEIVAIPIEATDLAAPVPGL